MTPARRPHLLVTDVDQRVGLHAAQTLGRAGWRITGTVTAGTTASRYVARAIRAAHADLPDLIEAVSARDALDLVLPVSINACRAIAAARRDGRPLPAVLGVDLETLERANDKLRVVRAAEACRVRAPRTVAVEGSEGAAAALAGFGLPAVVKIRNDMGTYLAPRARYRIVRTPGEAAGVRSAFPAGLPLLVQEYVAGGGAGVGLLIDGEGATRARIAYRRVREYPPGGGPSSLAETIADDGLILAAERLARELGIRGGVAHVEFKLTDSGPVVLEVNPRLWGTARLAEEAGQPFLERWAAIALGDGASRDLTFRPGVRARSLAHDLRCALESLGGGRPGRALRALLDLFDPRIRPLIFRRDDIRGSLALGLGVGRRVDEFEHRRAAVPSLRA